MKPISLDNILSLPDILDASRFLLTLGSIPGSTGGSDTQLSFKVSSFETPGMSHESFDVPLGTGLNFRGKRQYVNTMSITFYEDSKSNTLRPLREWFENIAGTNSGDSQGYIADYSIPKVQLDQFDTTGATIATYWIYRFYPIDVPSVPLNAESSQAMQITCTFKMTYFRTSLVPKTL